MHDVEAEVLLPETKDGAQRRVLVLVDPATGFQVHAILREDRAAIVGQKLTQPRPGLDAAAKTKK